MNTLSIDAQRQSMLVGHAQKFIGDCVCHSLQEIGFDVLKNVTNAEEFGQQNSRWKPKFLLFTDDFFNEAIADSNPNAKLIVLSQTKDINLLYRLQNGVHAIIHPDDALDSLLEAVRAINSNQFYLSSHHKSYLEKFNIVFDKTVDVRTQIKALSRREIEVLKLIAESGGNSKLISEKLFISYQTLMSHKLNISEKLALNGGRKAVTHFALINRQFLI